MKIDRKLFFCLNFPTTKNRYTHTQYTDARNPYRETEIHQHRKLTLEIDTAEAGVADAFVTIATVTATFHGTHQRNFISNEFFHFRHINTRTQRITPDDTEKTN